MWQESYQFPSHSLEDEDATSLNKIEKNYEEDALERKD